MVVYSWVEKEPKMVRFGYFSKYFLNYSPRVIDTKRPLGKSFSHDFGRVHRPVLETAKKVAGSPKLWNPAAFWCFTLYIQLWTKKTQQAPKIRYSDETAISGGQGVFDWASLHKKCEADMFFENFSSRHIFGCFTDQK